MAFISTKLNLHITMLLHAQFSCISIPFPTVKYPGSRSIIAYDTTTNF